MEKQCTKCRQVKPLDAYNKQAQGKHGRASRCRDCSKAEQADFRREHPDKKREQNKKWAEQNPDKVRATVDKAHKRYKEESRRTAVNNGKQWTEEDFVTLMRDDISVLEISKLLGRTYGSTQVKRSSYSDRLKRLEMIGEVQKRMAG